jgi:tetratricopeptide (TPR) repeat protein
VAREAEPTITRIGKYAVIDVIGAGGMGIVYRARDAALNRTVAIKMLRRSSVAGAQPSQVEKFFNRELLATASLQHKNIVTVYESGDENGDPYLVMECLDGEPVSRIIGERRPMPLVEKLEILVQVCDGLQYAHDRTPQVIHRDVKPGNVILLKDGTVKLVDFGIARIAGAETAVTQTGQLVGSLSYMSPEQINSLPIDSRTDIFSAGVLAYELVAYSLPFKGSDPASTFIKILREDPEPLHKYVPDVPPELEDVIYRALAKKQQDRYQTAEEFGFDLLSVQRKLKQGMTADYLQRAEAAIERGELERARQQLLEIVRLDRHHERANRLLAEVRKAIQGKERAAQVVQMRSQAHVALSGQQYEEALACIEQVMQLDPNDAESQALRDEIKKIVSVNKGTRDLLGRAESAMLAGDLDDAKRAVSQAIAWQPDNAEARALATMIEKELAERSRRAQVQDLVDSAREGISKHQYEEAIHSLRKAEELDPKDSNVRELLQWATRGKEQELRRKELLDLTEEIDRALRSEDFSSAFTICELALAKYPDEQTLVRLRAIAERQKSIAERRRFVQDQSLAARELIESGNLDAAIKLLEKGLSKIPAEPNFETLLARARMLVQGREAPLIGDAHNRAAAEERGLNRDRAVEEPASFQRALDEREQTAATILSPAIKPEPKKLKLPVVGGAIAATVLIGGAIGWYLMHRSADKTLTLTVETSPAGAAVQVNGQRCSSRPCTFSLPGNGSYEASADLAGYASAQKSGMLSENSKVVLELSKVENPLAGGSAPIEPIHPGSLAVTGLHPTDRLFVDGIRMAKPDKSGGWSVDAGLHHFKLSDGSQELFADARTVYSDSVLTIARSDFKAPTPLVSNEQIAKASKTATIAGNRDSSSQDSHHDVAVGQLERPKEQSIENSTDSSGRHKDAANSVMTAPQPIPNPSKVSDSPNQPASGSLSTANDTAAIHSILDDYEAAYESRSVDKLRAVFPALDVSRANRFSQLFQQFSQIRAPYSLVGPIKISGDLASVTVVLQLDGKGKKGQFKTNSTVTMHLQKNGGRWYVTSLGCSVFPPTLFDIPC